MRLDLSEEEAEMLMSYLGQSFCGTGRMCTVLGNLFVRIRKHYPDDHNLIPMHFDESKSRPGLLYLTDPRVQVTIDMPAGTKLVLPPGAKEVSRITK